MWRKLHKRVYMQLINLLMLINPTDATFVRKLDYAHFGSMRISAEQVYTWHQLVIMCKQLGVTAVATTRYPLFNISLEGTRESNLGYVHERDGISVLYLPDLNRIYKEAHMGWLCNHWLRKLSNPSSFIRPVPFSYKLLTITDYTRWESKLNSKEAVLCAIDIETVKDGLLITSCAFTVIFQRGGKLTSESGTINLLGTDYEDAMLLLRLLLRTDVAKVMHNGRYDCTYLLRFNALPVNYIFDTYHMQHCLYSELPKDLAFCTQMYLTGVRYWKEMSSYNKLEYNARDTHSTAWLWLGMMQHIKVYKAQYALRNYKIEFPLVFPCIHVGMEGLLVDEATRLRLRAIEVTKQETALARMRMLTGCPKFNPNSSVHVKNLMHALGYTEAIATDKKAMQHFAERGQIEAHIVRIIQSYRKATKAISTYYDVSLLAGRLMYSLDPAGTDTGRMASKESNFWCGTQIQNIPPYAKEMVVAEDGWAFFSVDGSQAESRCTAYISGDEQLIENVETSPDFHCTNASLFFGIPFEELYSVEHSKVLRKDIRTVGKRVNHGANYNMGAFVLWETMGDKEVFYAARMLDLPRHYDVTRITKTLLTCFNSTYPKIKQVWYPAVVDEVLTTGKLVGATGWTRRTFLNPRRSKPELNRCVAHPPQSLSVMAVNKAFLATWKRQITDWSGRIRLKAQIHDEVFGIHRIGDTELVQEIGRIFTESSRTVIAGRTMVIPCDPKHSALTWGELKE